MNIELDLDLGENLILELDTFGSIFTGGFESGDTAAWEASSPDTFTFTVSSNDVNFRFIIVLEPPRDREASENARSLDPATPESLPTEPPSSSDHRWSVVHRTHLFSAGAEISATGRFFSGVD
jgi:hypothetical protein